MPFCYAPWTNIDIDPTGKMTPCCKFQSGLYDQQFTLQQHSISDYLGSKFLAEVKDDFKKGLWPVGCERCRIEEENKIDSKRLLDRQRWSDQYDQWNFGDGLLTASIAFGNTCNLKCITCSSYSSSRWQQEYKDIYHVDIKHFRFYKQNFLEDFTGAAPDLIHIDIPGGEPFLSGVDEQKSLLQYYIDQGRAKEITLHYTTNGTIFPDESWWELWSHFKEIDLQLSIDGVGDRYEYIRYPGVWADLTANVDRYVNQTALTNFRLSVSHTVSAYSVFYLDEFVNWCYTVGLPAPWLGRVHRPQHMRPSVWAGPARAKIIRQLESSEYLAVRRWAGLIINTDDTDQFETFKQRLHEHDQYRNLDFRKTFPELAEYI